MKDQLTRLSAADFRIGTARDGRSLTLKGSVIEGFELWTSRDLRQRVLWPTTVTFSQRYFDSLMRHAVPLEKNAPRGGGNRIAARSSEHGDVVRNWIGKSKGYARPRNLAKTVTYGSIAAAR